ncbi:hypothetical protein K3495_g554 [Podosphaera aphanis]|nr:hypothetical protein K3495_g554 [Podosphaera aphanis]
MCNEYNGFEATIGYLEASFGDPDPRGTARRELTSLKRGRGVSKNIILNVNYSIQIAQIHPRTFHWLFKIAKSFLNAGLPLNVNGKQKMSPEVLIPRQSATEQQKTALLGLFRNSDTAKTGSARSTSSKTHSLQQTPPAFELSAPEPFLATTQRTSGFLATFYSQFLLIISYLDYNESTKVDAITEGLSDDLNDALSYRTNLSIDLETT